MSYKPPDRTSAVTGSGRIVVSWHNAHDWIPKQCPTCKTPGGELNRWSVQDDKEEFDSWICPNCGTTIKRACKYIEK